MKEVLKIPTKTEEENRGTFLVVINKSYDNNNIHDNEDQHDNSNDSKARSILTNTLMSATWSSPSSPTYFHCNSKSQFVLPQDNDTIAIIVNVHSDTSTSTTKSTSRPASSDVPTNMSKINNVMKLPISRQSSSISTITNSCSDTTDRTNNLDDDAATLTSYAKYKNSTLNLHLGLPFNPRKIYVLKVICHILSFILSYSCLEDYLFRIWDMYIPLKLRQSVSISTVLVVFVTPFILF